MRRVCLAEALRSLRVGKSARNARVARSRRGASMGWEEQMAGGLSRDISPALAAKCSLCELSDLCERYGVGCPMSGERGVRW